MKSSPDSRTVLLTLGRLPVALELARALRSGGWRVLVADPYAWHLCRLSNTVHKSFKVTAPVVDLQRYLEELEQIVESEHVALVLPVSEETLFVSELKSRLPDSVALLCMDKSTLLQLHDKYCFATFAVSLDLPVPTTVLANDGPACKALMVEPFVVKPRQSCAGAGVRLGPAGGILTCSEITDRSVVQQRLSGAACSSFTIAAVGRTLTSVCYRSLLESGSVAVCFEQIAVPEAITQFIDTVVQATEYSGMIAFDFIQNDAGLWCAIECNPRATSGIHFVEQAHLLSTLLDQNPVDSSHLSDNRQEFWSCLMQVEGALFKGRVNSPVWKNLFTTRDITFQVSDLKPFFFMTIILAPQFFRSIFSSKSMPEVLMTDVGWRERRE